MNLSGYLATEWYNLLEYMYVFTKFCVNLEIYTYYLFYFILFYLFIVIYLDWVSQLQFNMCSETYL